MRAPPRSSGTFCCGFLRSRCLLCSVRPLPFKSVSKLCFSSRFHKSQFEVFWFLFLSYRVNVVEGVVGRFG
jgi:hypothetical protein